MVLDNFFSQKYSVCVTVSFIYCATCMYNFTLKSLHLGQEIYFTFGRFLILKFILLCLKLNVKFCGYFAHYLSGNFRFYIKFYIVPEMKNLCK